VALICISIITDDVECLFTYLLAICISSSLSSPSLLPIFKIRLSFFVVELYEFSLYSGYPYQGTKWFAMSRNSKFFSGSVI
jgi:hypothetical protein